MRAALEQRLYARRLTPHPTKTQCFPVRNGVPFLGFRLYPNHRRILRPNLQRFAHRMREYEHLVATGQLEVDRVRRSLCAWMGYADPARPPPGGD